MKPSVSDVCMQAMANAGAKFATKHYMTFYNRHVSLLQLVARCSYDHGKPSSHLVWLLANTGLDPVEVTRRNGCLSSFNKACLTLCAAQRQQRQQRWSPLRGAWVRACVRVR
jgi:hypothetical protein